MAKKRRKKVGKKSSALRGRPPGAASLRRVGTEVLMHEIARRERDSGNLARERADLLARIAEIDAEMEIFSGSSTTSSQAPKRGRTAGKKSGRRGGKRGPRPKNDMTLEETIAKVLKGKVMGVTEVARAVLNSGYKTNAANFRTMVNQTLIKSDRFRKESRGQYTTA